MTKRQEYDISFQKKTDASGNIFKTAISSNSDNLDIAFHIVHEPKIIYSVFRIYQKIK